MQHLTTDLYDALTLYYTDESQWIMEDRHHPGTYCVSTADDVPGDWHWQLVCPEELEARRDDLEDEAIRQEEERAWTRS